LFFDLRKVFPFASSPTNPPNTIERAMMGVGARRGLCLLLALFFGGGAEIVSAQTCTSTAATSDPAVANGVNQVKLAAAQGAGGPLQYKGCSEVVDMYGTLQEQYPQGGKTWVRNNCPHLQAGLTNWEDEFGYGLNTGANVVIATGKKVLLRPCSLRGDGQLNPGGVILRRITVQTGAVLVFDDADITLHLEEIVVEAGGKLEIGAIVFF
jgi:G8 domain